MLNRRTLRKTLSVTCYLTLFFVACVVYKHVLISERMQGTFSEVMAERTTDKGLFRKCAKDEKNLPGDMGHPVSLSNSSAVKELIKEGLDTFGYNQYASDLMSVRRRLPDVRDEWCRVSERANSESFQALPPTSIVIVFYNEAWSVLLRTVHSILDRTPDRLIREIVLVDDCSTASYLKTRLDDYIAPFAKVRILRLPKRMGLIAAKVLGAKATSEKIITFLDAHVGCTVGWLEPLLREVAANETTIAIPTIDQIDPLSMEVTTDFAPRVVGTYRWDLNFGWWGRAAMSKRYPNPFVAFDTPAMAGGLFTINRAFFERLGWYDEGFETYGIENIELSMKSWMCGGRMVIVPCSRVAHVWKYTHPYLATAKVDIIQKNSVRLAEVWMDEYRQVIFDVYGIPRYLEDHYGSVKTRKEIRRQAQCGTFRDYVLRGFPEMMNPLVPGAFRGEVRNAALSRTLCLTRAWANNALSMAPCNGGEKEQYWTHNFYSELNNYSGCIEPRWSDSAKVYQPQMARCNRKPKPGTQRWRYQVSSQHIQSETVHLCLAASEAGGSSHITIEPCDPTKRNQKWLVKFVQLDTSIFRYY